MPATVIMPALELAQETGKVLRWLKHPGDSVRKGEPIVEIETDKVTVEVEAPAAGVLGEVSAQPGDVVPVGRTIALILGAGETGSPAAAAPAAAPTPAPEVVRASPLARKVAEQHGVDIAQVRTASGRIEKADVLATSRAARARRATARRPPPALPWRRPRRAGWRPSGAWTCGRYAAPGPGAPSSPSTFPRRQRARLPPRRPASAASGASWPSA